MGNDRWQKLRESLGYESGVGISAEETLESAAWLELLTDSLHNAEDPGDFVAACQLQALNRQHRETIAVQKRIAVAIEKIAERMLRG